MSDLSAEDLQVRRIQSEMRKWDAEFVKLMAEQVKLSAEQVKFNAESAKLSAEAAKFRVDRFVAPLVAVAVVAGAVGSWVTLLLKGH